MKLYKLTPLSAICIATLIASGCSSDSQKANETLSAQTMTVSQKANPLATHGVVTSPNYLATQAGLDVLRRGGNAVDAAIATAATLTVVYPQMCTLGGDNFWLIYNAKTGELKADAVGKLEGIVVDALIALRYHRIEWHLAHGIRTG